MNKQNYALLHWSSILDKPIEKGFRNTLYSILEHKTKNSIAIRKIG